MENTAIMIPAKPKECANILNLIQSILVRKTFLKDYVGWVYIYCTKDNKEGLHVAKDKWVSIKHNKVLKECCHNGEVVARFWCDKVEEIHCGIHYEPEVDIGIAVLPEFTCEEYSTETLGHFDLLRKACLADYTLPYLSAVTNFNCILQNFSFSLKKRSLIFLPSSMVSRLFSFLRRNLCTDLICGQGT